MQGVIDIPYIKCFVSNSLIKGKDGFTEAYAFAVKSFLNRPLLFTVHTVDGAVYSDIPLLYLSHDPSTGIEYIPAEERDPWGCLGERISVSKFSYLKDYRPLYIGNKKPKNPVSGRYLMSFSWLPDGGFSEDPEQAKMMHLVALEDGWFALWPNNYLHWPDKHFATKPLEKYQRNLLYWESNG